MHYKTITLGLIEQHPALHQQLMAKRALPQVLHQLATALARCHHDWITALQASLVSNPTQLSQMAMELAVQELQECLPSESDELEPFPFEAAIAFIRRHTPGMC